MRGRSYQTSVDVLEEQFTYRKSSLYSANRQTLTDKLTPDVTSTSSMELLLQISPHIVARREGDRVSHSVITTFLSCVTSFRLLRKPTTFS